MIKFNVIQNEITEKLGIDFTPKKNLETDRCYDIRAYSLFENDKENENFESIAIKPKESAIFGLGFSIEYEGIIELLNQNFVQILSLNTILLNAIKELFQKNNTMNIFNNIKQQYNSITDSFMQNANTMNIRFIPSSEIKSRSGLGFKHSIELFNGQIDNTYNNQIRIKVTNNSKKAFTVNQGDRIGQLKIELLPLLEHKTEYKKSSSELDGNDRGGFGSSGVN